MDMTSMAKTLVVMTKEYNKGLKKKSMFNQGKNERDDRGDRRGYGGYEKRGYGREEFGDQREQEKRGDERRQAGQRCRLFQEKKAEYYTQSSLMVEQDNLVIDESSDEGDTNALFCGMADFNSSEVESELENKLAFYEQETRLLTQEKDKLYDEKKSLVAEHISKKKYLKEKDALLDKALKSKIKELKDKSDKLNVVSLKNFFQKEREVIHQDLLDRDLLTRKYQDAQKVHEKVNSQVGRRGIGFTDIDPYTGNKRNKSLANIFCPGKFLKPSLPNLTSTFKRRRTSDGPYERNPRVTTSVWYENSDLSSSPSV
ncbi:hypothetical protein L6452_32782 [Arctium lappa]|uniref:Uncharacterized protein n=1 Tax=Arctium lappa TaxID=4217 RepID=A0ACB8Z5A2_ARCLA|nr:hypothetical protein L6452_32782 [Arctium lappa]